eukprot:SAG31_NODE_41647_length_275_cov_0.590909_1_plen_55_part_10
MNSGRNSGRNSSAKPAISAFENDYCQLGGGPIVLFRKGRLCNGDGVSEDDTGSIS